MKGESKLLLLYYEIEAKKFRIILSFKLCFNDNSPQITPLHFWLILGMLTLNSKFYAEYEYSDHI